MKKMVAIVVALLPVLVTGCAADSGSVTLKGQVQNNIVSSTTTAAGKILQMNVELGQIVRKGDVIAVLDSSNQKFQVDQLQAVVNLKTARLSELTSGSRPQLITQAQAQVNAAKAQVDAAKQNLAKVSGGARTEEIAAAQAGVDQAQSSLSGARVSHHTLSDSLDTAESNYDALLVSMASFKDASGDYSPAAAIAALDAQASAHLITDAQYTEKVDAINRLFAQKSQLESSIDQLRGQVRLASTQVDTLQAGVSASESKLALTEAGATSYDVQVLVDQVKGAQSGYDAAAAQLSLLRSGATSQAVAMAQADLDQSSAQLGQAKYALDNCTIVALQDGVITSKNYDLGDVVASGNNLADISALDDLYVLSYLPVKYLDKVSYGQELEVRTSLGTQKGRLVFVDVNSEYTPKDLQSSSDTEKESVKIKVAIAGDGGKLKSGLAADVVVPLT